MTELRAWEFLQNTCDVWCISLKEREDRYIASRMQFKKIGLLDQVRYIRPTRDARGGSFGCWDSHKECLEKSSKRCMNALIFEDDVAFENNWFDMYKIIKNVYTSGNWDLLRLGCLIRSLSKQVSPSVWLGTFDWTQSYFISYKYMIKCLEDPAFTPSSSIHIDEYYIRTCDRDVAVYPCIAYQSSTTTDNTWGSVFNICQHFIQNKYMFYFNQRATNFLSWCLQGLPTGYQRLNIYSSLLDLHDYVN
jgi:hypothetical protein